MVIRYNFSGKFEIIVEVVQDEKLNNMPLLILILVDDILCETIVNIVFAFTYLG